MLVKATLLRTSTKKKGTKTRQNAILRIHLDKIRKLQLASEIPCRDRKVERQDWSMEEDSPPRVPPPSGFSLLSPAASLSVFFFLIKSERPYHVLNSQGLLFSHPSGAPLPHWRQISAKHCTGSGSDEALRTGLGLSQSVCACASCWPLDFPLNTIFGYLSKRCHLDTQKPRCSDRKTDKHAESSLGRCASEKSETFLPINYLLQTLNAVAEALRLWGLIGDHDEFILLTTKKKKPSDEKRLRKAECIRLVRWDCGMCGMPLFLLQTPPIASSSCLALATVASTKLCEDV